MRNFFQRKQDSQAQPNPRSHTAANEAYKVWLPGPKDTSRGPPPAPKAWIPTTTQSGARTGGETQSRARADASAVPTSSAYKYATLPNSTGFYYSNNPAPLAQPVPVQPYPSQQYYPQSPTPARPPPPDRPDSRLGYVPYPYPNPNPNPQYPQAFAAPPPSQTVPSKKQREGKTRNTASRSGPSTVPETKARPSSSRKDDGTRVRQQPSSSSIREQQTEDTAMKKPKHRPRETSEPRKRRDSQVGDPYAAAEKHRDRSSRKEALRRDARAEEGDSSDSSVQRPSLGHRREGKSMMDNPPQGPTPFPNYSRTGVPMQPSSSSGGRHTPQIQPRMPVYLPANQARAQRASEDQPGQSESDTDHGGMNRGRNSSRNPAPPSSKPSAKHMNAVGGPSTLTTLNKKVKESKGLWPFSRSRSAQKLPESTQIVAPPMSAKKGRAESTPSRFPIDDRPTARPEYRRHASDNDIGTRPDPPNARATAPPEGRSSQPEGQPSTSRALFFATSGEGPSGPPASQRPAFQSRPSDPRALGPGLYATSQPAATSSSFRPNPVQTGFPPDQISGYPAGPNPLWRPTTPLRRDGRDTSILPPLYGPPVAAPAVAPTSDYPRVPDRSTTPKVSRLVAGFEARSLEAQAPAPQPKPPPMPARRETAEKPSPPRSHPPPQPPPQGLASTSAQASAAINPYITASQPPPRTRTTSDTSIRPLVDSSNMQGRPPINQPDVLKTALRDLLTDQPAASRNDDRSRKTHESRNNQTAYLNSAPPQPYPIAQPPIQVYNAGIPTSSAPLRSASKGEMPPEVAPLPNLSSRRPDDSANRTRQGGSSRPGDGGRDGARGGSSRPKKEKDTIAVMKTPSKDSSKHTSSPSSSNPQPAHQSRSNERSSPSKPSTSRSQPQPTYPELLLGRQAPALVPSNAPPVSSLAPGDKTSQRDHRPSATKHSSSRDLPSNSTNVPTSSSERTRPIPSTSTSAPTLPFPSTQPLPTSRRSPVPASAPILMTEGHPNPRVQSSSRPTGSSSNQRSMARVPSEESILKTPSSLAHSVLPPLQPSVSRQSNPASVSSEMKKKGIFGAMFRSKETQPESRSERRRERSRSPRRHIDPSSQNVTDPTSTSDRKPKSKVPPSLAVPNPALPISERPSPTSRVFTPFRYLSNKRNRRVSTASMDAVDGTAANTVMGSPTASMQSSQIPPHSPPRRDPRVATQDWRNQEESATLARGRRGRLRPGVVFDVAENPLEETKRSKVTRIKKPKPQAQAEEPPEQPTTTDSSDG
ncbi:hypothetical protein K438DRAFT_2010549 [Mycena galopus ATCC 62051]|nr:hypothetical protein K438DRAFT_2010549 [Mycena galopus ATCC 62051]